MRLASLVLILVCAWCPVVGAAQDATDVERIAAAMVRLCLEGGRAEVPRGAATGAVDLALRSFDAKGNLRGEFKISISSAEGLVNGIHNALSQVPADQADKVRACLEPVRERLLDVMLPQPGEHSTLCRFTSGPRAGQTQDYAPMAPLPVGALCQDGAGSTGVVVTANTSGGPGGGPSGAGGGGGPAQQPGEHSTLCSFTSGPRAGQTQDYAPMAPLPVGTPCQDGTGSTGIVVTATSGGPPLSDIDAALSKLVKGKWHSMPQIVLR
jgi:hypothetical protein